MAGKKTLKVDRSIVAKARKVLAVAKQRAAEAENQLQLRNLLYAPEGLVTTTFPTADERRAYFKTKEADLIRALILSLPRPQISNEEITVFIPPAENGTKLKARPKSHPVARRR